MLKEGDIVPDFTLDGVSVDGSCRSISLYEFEGKNIVLYFYPADSEVVCLPESCVFRDRLNIVENALVIGISPDDTRSHVEFKKKCYVNFVLMTDEDHKVGDMFDAWDYDKNEMHRYTFLLNGDKKIVKAWYNPDVSEFVRDPVQQD